MSIFIPIIVFIIFFVVLSFIAKAMFQHYHIEDTMKNMIDTVSAYPEKTLNEVLTEKVHQTSAPEIKCEYCGSTIKEGQNQCEHCGAKVKNKK